MLAGLLSRFTICRVIGSSGCLLGLRVQDLGLASSA